ncbi:MAG: transporter substrate-binding domain-containing protein [Phycisphaeraceae bacterium]
MKTWMKTAAAALIATAGLSAGLAGCSEANQPDTFDVALTGQYPPFSFYDDQGELVGFDVDVANAIGEDLGQEVNFVATPWSGIVAGLQAGRYDAIIGSMAVTPERAEAVDFSEPYYLSGAQLFVHERYAEEIESIEDVGDRSLGVVVGETYQRHLEENYPQIDVRGYEGTPLIFADVKNDRLAGFVTDRLVGLYQIQSADEPFVPAGDMLYTEQMAIPVAPGSEELLTRINAALEQMKQSGELAQIHETWFGTPGELGEAPAESDADEADATG